jgi:hypothetical protein
MEVEKKMNENFNDLLPDEQVKKNLGFKEAVTYVGIINDHSGSMGEQVDIQDAKLKSDLAMSNYNEQIATLKKESEEGMETLVTVIEFDNEILCEHDNVPVEDMKPLKEYWTRGMTSLYDAIAYGISRVKKHMEADERENKAALIIVETDGYENSSADYHGEEGRKRLKTLIEELEGSGKWTFTFLGAGLDEEFANQMGMSFGNIMSPRAGNISDTVNAYSSQSQGLKTFLGARKKGEFQTKTFYSAPEVGKDPGDGSINETKDEG